MLKRPNDNDKTPPDQPTTYHQLAQSSLALEGSGRFAVDAAVVGTAANAGSVYPAAGVVQGDLAVEPPLGDDLHPGPVGEPHEIAASIERLERQREGGE
jgi:hypothetical protein